MNDGLGRARLQLLGAALLFSTGGAAIKATTLSSAQIAGFRSGVAVLAVLLLAPSARRLPGARAWLVGVAYAGTVILYALANKLTTAANTIFLQSTAPLYVLLLALFFVGAEPPRTTAPDPAAGNLLAAASGITWAATILGLRWMGSAPSPNGAPIHAVMAGNTLAFLACLPFALPIVSFTSADAAAVLYLGALQIALPYLLVAAAVRRLPALEVSLVLLVEPVINPLWAFALHGEVPGALAMTGGAILLAATGMKSWLDARAK
jgi:drug/metabolite transporter, DME family